MEKLTTPIIHETLDDSLILYLVARNRCKGNKLFDLTKYKNHGTIHGVTWKSGHYGMNRLDFNGTTDYIEVFHNNIFESKTTFSVAVWGKRYTGKNGMYIFKGNLQDRSIWVAVDDSGVFTGGFEEEGTGANIIATGNTIISENVWHHLVVTFNGSDIIYLYHDGIKDGERINIIETRATNTNSLVIGKDGPNGTLYSNGNIANIRVYNKTLFPDEISQLFNDTKYLYGI